jgi:hypothetical protein
VNFPVVPPDAGNVAFDFVVVVVVVVERVPPADREDGAGGPKPCEETSAVTAAATATMATTLTTQYRCRWTSIAINSPLVRV